MSAINIITLREVAYLFGDGAGYDADGVIGSIGGKAHVISHISTALLFSGRSILAPYIIHLLEGKVRSFDHLCEILPDSLESYEDELTRLFDVDIKAAHGGKQGYRMFVAGWSDRRQRMVAFSIASTADDNGLLPYTIYEADPDGGFQCPGVTNEQCFRGYGALPTVNEQTIEDVALTTLELQRQEPFPGSDGRYLIGGLIEFVAVRRDRIETRILKRWEEDKIGELIRPRPIDWNAWRARRTASAAIATIPEGLSRLQRERMEKKARKGTLRAV